MLFLGGLNAAAQEKTAPPPAPGKDTSAPPAPGKDTVAPVPPEKSASPLPDPAKDGTKPPAAPSGGTAQRPATGGGSQARSSVPPATAPATAAPGRTTAQTSTAAAASTAPETGVPDKGMFWGVTAGYSDFHYEDKADFIVKGEDGFNVGLLFGYDFGLLVAQAELLYTMEFGRVSISPWSGGFVDLNFDASSIQIPVLLKLDLHLWRFVFQPLAGVYVNFPLGDLNYRIDNVYSPGGLTPSDGSFEYEDSPLFGVMAGLTVGFRIGRGHIFLDARYAANLGETEVSGLSIVGEYKRSATTVNIGYQYYFKGKQ
jgi:hypothetical protein